MKAGLRLIIACWTAALALMPALALAQQTTPPSTANTQTTGTPSADAPPTGAVGPRELQNFNLSGRVTRQADQPPAVQPAPTDRPGPSQPRASAPPVASTAAPANAPARTATDDQPQRTAVASANSDPSPAPASEPLSQPPPSSSVTVPLPGFGTSAADSAPASGPVFAPPPEQGNLAPRRGPDLLPWLLAAIALGAGGAFLFWRNRSREAFAGAPQADAFTAPEAAPRPVPRPVTRPVPAPPRGPAPTPSIPGLVSTRLRPWVEIGFRPLRCVVDAGQATIEFEAELFNSGSAPARAVLAEASLFNAGPTQDQELAGFFANPVGEGERIVELAPLKRVTLRSQVVAPLSHIQRYEMAGHQVFVPVIAFNALYRWSNGEGQTSVSYLVGRDTKTDKLGPFRLDLGPRIFRGLSARVLAAGMRQ